MPKLIDNHALLSILFVLAAMLLTALIAVIIGVRADSMGHDVDHREVPGLDAAALHEPHGEADGSEDAHGGQEEHGGGGAAHPEDEYALVSHAEQDSPAQAAVRMAVNALQPEAGIAMLEQALAKPEFSDDEHALMYTAMGRLSATSIPPNPEREQSSFAMAASLAQSPATRAELVRAQAELLLDRDDLAGAVAKIREGLEDLPRGAPERLALRLFLGNLFEMDQNTAEAEATYRVVLEEARGLDEPALLELYLRQAALSLSRLYRATSRPDEADKLAKLIHAELRAFTPTEPAAEPEHGDAHAAESHAEEHGDVHTPEPHASGSVPHVPEHAESTHAPESHSAETGHAAPEPGHESVHAPPLASVQDESHAPAHTQDGHEAAPESAPDGHSAPAKAPAAEHHEAAH